MPPPMIAGLYPYTRNGIARRPTVTLSRRSRSAWRQIRRIGNDLLVLAGDDVSAAQIESFGLRAHRVFNDAPVAVRVDAAHKMKHWMCRWALKEFGEFLWVDWDTVLLRRPDQSFWAWCRRHSTPKFIHIPGYWATVNCGVYYAGREWAQAMERSFTASASEPNDELLWVSVLPEDVLDRTEFWWGRRVVQIWSEEDFRLVGPDTYFAHVKHLEWARALRMTAA